MMGETAGVMGEAVGVTGRPRLLTKQHMLLELQRRGGRFTCSLTTSATSGALGPLAKPSRGGMAESAIMDARWWSVVIDVWSAMVDLLVNGGQAW